MNKSKSIKETMEFITLISLTTILLTLAIAACP